MLAKTKDKYLLATLQSRSAHARLAVEDVLILALARAYYQPEDPLSTQAHLPTQAKDLDWATFVETMDHGLGKVDTLLSEKDSSVQGSQGNALCIDADAFNSTACHNIASHGENDDNREHLKGGFAQYTEQARHGDAKRALKHNKQGPEQQLQSCDCACVKKEEYAQHRADLNPMSHATDHPAEAFMAQGDCWQKAGRSSAGGAADCFRCRTSGITDSCAAAIQNSQKIRNIETAARDKRIRVAKKLWRCSRRKYFTARLSRTQLQEKQVQYRQLATAFKFWGLQASYMAEKRMAMLTSSALDRLKAAISHWVSKFAARRLTERVWLAWRHAHFTTVMRRLQQGLGTDTTHDCSLRTMGGDIDCCAAWGPHTEVPKPIPKPCHRDQGQVIFHGASAGAILQRVREMHCVGRGTSVSVAHAIRPEDSADQGREAVTALSSECSKGFLVKSSKALRLTKRNGGTLDRRSRKVTTDRKSLKAPIPWISV